MKKILLILCTALLMVSCTSLQGNQNNEVQNLEAKIKEFFKDPLLNEKGELIPVDNFDLKETKDFRIVYNGIVTTEELRLDGFDPFKQYLILGYIIELKDPKMKLEYVKVQSVIPNSVITFIDETLEGKTSRYNILNGAKVVAKIKKEEGSRFWVGMVANMPGIILSTTDRLDKYLFKFTIKPVNKPETVIYQPTILPVMLFAPN